MSLPRDSLYFVNNFGLCSLQKNINAVNGFLGLFLNSYYSRGIIGRLESFLDVVFERVSYDDALDIIHKFVKKKKLKVKVVYDGPIEAPIKKDQLLAKLKIVYDQDLIGEYDLLAAEEIKKVNIFSRLIKSVNYLVWGDI